MRFLKLVPLVSLALVLVVLGSALLLERPVVFPFTEPPEGSDVPRVDLRLGDLVLEGAVVDGDGAAVEGAGVTTHQEGRPVWTWTDGNGSFELTNLAPGEVEILVVALGFEATRFEAVDVATAGDGEPLRLVLERRISEPPTPEGLDFGPLTGSVEFGPLARPDEGYELLLLPSTAPTDPDGGFPVRAPVQPDGTVHFELVHAGHYRVVLLSPEDRGALGPDLLADARGSGAEFTYATGGDTPRLAVRSNAGAIRGTVHGTIADAAGDRNVPLRGALVRAQPLTPESDDPEPADDPDRADRRSDFRATRTDTEGRYELNDVAAGRYELTFVAGTFRARRIVDVTEGAVVDVDVVEP